MLSEEDKRRIEAEEAYRAEIRMRESPPRSARVVPKKGKISCMSIGCATLVVIFGLGMTMSQIFNSSTKTGTTEPTKPLSTNRLESGPTPESAIFMTDFGWQTTRGNAVLNFVLSNASPSAKKDFQIRCNFSGPSGTHLHRAVETLYSNLPSGNTLTVKGFNMGAIPTQVTNASCILLGYARAE